jgi:hypothetical protein
MSPTEGELHVPALGECAIAAISIHLQNALEACQMSDRPLGLELSLNLGDGRSQAAAA